MIFIYRSCPISPQTWEPKMSIRRWPGSSIYVSYRTFARRPSKRGHKVNKSSKDPVLFATSWRRLNQDVLKTSPPGRLYLDVLKTSLWRPINDVINGTSWGRLSLVPDVRTGIGRLQDVPKTSVLAGKLAKIFPQIWAWVAYELVSLHLFFL